MKNNLILLFLILFHIASFAQNKDPIEKNRLNIPSTRVSIVPPNEFQIASSFVGLQKGETSGIQIYELVGGNFSNNGKTFNKENFENNGAKVSNYEEIKIDGFSAKFIEMQGSPNQKSIVLVFGDETFSVMIMSLFPSNDGNLKDEIKKSILSIKYDKNKIINDFEAVIFELDDSRTKLKFAKKAASAFLYSNGGIKKDSYKNEPVMLVITLPKEDYWTPKDASIKMLDGLKSNGYTDVKIIKTDNEKLNNLSCNRLLTEGILNNKTCKVFIQTVIIDDAFVVMQGISYHNFANELNDFKELGKTIKRK